MFVLATALIVGGSVGGARAVITNSETYQSQLNLLSIDVELNSSVLLTGIVSENEKFSVGKYYDQPLNVTNTGSVDSYVRVIISRYWEKNGDKDTTLDPEMIGITFTGGNWILDEKFSSDERIIFYYALPLSEGDTTENLIDKICIDSKVAKIKAYDGASFRLDVEADSVQSHNAQHAIISSWGRNVTISGETLGLAD